MNMESVEGRERFHGTSLLIRRKIQMSGIEVGSNLAIVLCKSKVFIFVQRR